MDEDIPIGSKRLLSIISLPHWRKFRSQMKAGLFSMWMDCVNRHQSAAQTDPNFQNCHIRGPSVPFGTGDAISHQIKCSSALKFCIFNCSASIQLFHVVQSSFTISTGGSRNINQRWHLWRLHLSVGRWIGAQSWSYLQVNVSAPFIYIL